MNTLNAGEEYDKLQESYVIFITRGDPLGDKLPIYHISRNIEETNKKFTDETHIIYVNSSKQDDTELGHLMHDLYCKNADDMYSKVLADRVRELKETQKGEESMCKELEELIKLGVADGRIEGRAEGKTEIQREVALALDRRGMQPDEDRRDYRSTSSNHPHLARQGPEPHKRISCPQKAVVKTDSFHSLFSA